MSRADTLGVIGEIERERFRQIESENWTPEHDDAHRFGEMSAAAACYALYPDYFSDADVKTVWPWSREWWKPKGRRRDLVRAAALIVAEIERLDRAAKRAA